MHILTSESVHVLVLTIEWSYYVHGTNAITIGSHSQHSRIPYSWTLMVVKIFCPETSIQNYYSLRNTPKAHSSQLLRGGCLISHVCAFWKEKHVRYTELTYHPSHDTSYFVCQLKQVSYSWSIKQLVLQEHKKHHQKKVGKQKLMLQTG